MDSSSEDEHSPIPVGDMGLDDELDNFDFGDLPGGVSDSSSSSSDDDVKDIEDEVKKNALEHNVFFAKHKKMELPEEEEKKRGGFVMQGLDLSDNSSDGKDEPGGLMDLEKEDSDDEINRKFEEALKSSSSSDGENMFNFEEKEKEDSPDEDPLPPEESSSSEGEPLLNLNSPKKVVEEDIQVKLEGLEDPLPPEKEKEENVIVEKKDDPPPQQQVQQIPQQPIMQPQMNPQMMMMPQYFQPQYMQNPNQPQHIVLNLQIPGQNIQQPAPAPIIQKAPTPPPQQNTTNTVLIVKDEKKQKSESDLDSFDEFESDIEPEPLEVDDPEEEEEGEELEMELLKPVKKKVRLCPWDQSYVEPMLIFYAGAALHVVGDFYFGIMFDIVGLGSVWGFVFTIICGLAPLWCHYCGCNRCFVFHRYCFTKFWGVLNIIAFAYHIIKMLIILSMMVGTFGLFIVYFLVCCVVCCVCTCCLD